MAKMRIDTKTSQLAPTVALTTPSASLTSSPFILYLIVNSEGEVCASDVVHPGPLIIPHRSFRLLSPDPLHMICGRGLGILLLPPSISKALLRPNVMAQEPSFFNAQHFSIPVCFHFALVCRFFLFHPHLCIHRRRSSILSICNPLMVPTVLCLSSPSTTPLSSPLLFHHLVSLIGFLD